MEKDEKTWEAREDGGTGEDEGERRDVGQKVQIFSYKKCKF